MKKRSMKKAVVTILLCLIFNLWGCGESEAPALDAETPEAEEMPGGGQSSDEEKSFDVGKSADAGMLANVERLSAVMQAIEVPTQAKGPAPEPFVDKLTPEGRGWGLSFGEPGKQPAGNVSVEELKQYNAYYMGNDEEKVIYLTFDCGYENGNTEAILDALDRHGAPATFFVVGHYLEAAPELVKRMAQDGHAVGSHTYHHPDVNTLTEDAFREEMDSLKELYSQVTGGELAMYYRPPEGKCGIENLKMAQELGYATIFWSLAHVDWDTENQPSRGDALDKLTERIHPGAIVLLHNTSRTNGEILDELLTAREEMGYSFEPLSAVLQGREGEAP